VGFACRAFLRPAYFPGFARLPESSLIGFGLGIHILPVSGAITSSILLIVGHGAA